MRMKKGMLKKPLIGGAIGIVNGFFGSGGGILAVAAMEKLGLEEKKSHASALLVILPLSIVSGVIYMLSGSLEFSTEMWWLLGGAAAGGLLGALLLSKLCPAAINWIFTVLIIASGVRMLF